MGVAEINFWDGARYWQLWVGPISWSGHMFLLIWSWDFMIATVLQADI